jgi:hypothetical protein
MRRFTLFLIFLLVAAGALRAADKPATMLQLPPKPLLPMSFAGWTALSAPVETTAAPADQQALFTELGFKRKATATYNKNSVSLNVEAYQFQDATGAFGQYAGLGDGNPPISIVIEVKGGGDYDAEMRADDTVVFARSSGQLPPGLHNDLVVLSKTLPIPFGSKAELPSLPDYLPKNGLNDDSVQYALGPAGFASAPSPLAGKLDFNTGAEVVVANYHSGMLTLVEYPTPQMAAAQLQSIATILQLTPQKDLPDGLLGGNNEVIWRTGPLVALTSSMPQTQAVKLAHELHYEPEITWNHPEGYVSDAWRAAHLYLGIFALAGILCSASIILGLFFGGARAISRVLRGKSASSVQDIEFIRLDIERPVREQAAPPQTPPE